MHLSSRKNFFSFLMGLFLIIPALADTHHTPFLQTQWTSEKGLPQNSVTSIAQTNDGYLWIATFGGLARFDGVKFKIYTSANTPELKSNRIISLATDLENYLWIGTERGEIIVYRDGVFKLIDDGKAYENKIASDIFIEDTGKIWVSGLGGLRTCTPAGCERIEFPEKLIGKVRKDITGRIWVTANQKLFYLENGKFVKDEKVKFAVLNLEINQNSGLWLVTYGQMGAYWDGKFTPLIPFDREVVTTAMVNQPDGSLWFNQGQTLYQIKNEKIESYEISNVSYIGRQIFFDKENNIWLGRNVDGLIRLVKRQVENIVLDPEPWQGKPIPVAVNSIVEDREGNIWLSSNPNLYKWHNGKVEKITSELANIPFAGRGALLVDHKGVLWNTTSEGLQSFHAGKSISHQDISWKKSPVGNALFEDLQKNLWYGNSEYGVFVSKGDQIIARYNTQNGLVDNAVSYITNTRDGAIWIATRGGVSRLQNGVFTNYTTKEGLSNEYVRDIYEDEDKTIWFGTYGGGLNRFRNGKFTPIMSKDGLFDDIVSRILVDNEDNFWMLGNRGIYSVNRTMLNDFADGKIKRIFCVSYTTADGMQTSEGNGGNQNAGIRARDGKLWFPTIDGVVVIDPKREKLPSPKPLIEEIQVERGLNNITDKLELNPDHEDVEINYTATSFRKPEQIRFRYRLLGLEDHEEWEEVGTRRTAYFPKVPPGEYVFQVIASNTDGKWSEEIAELRIISYSPFYLTWWFIGLCTLLGIGLILMAFQYRTWQFEKEKRVREEFARRLINAQDIERRRFASEIHDNLGQQLLIIKNWAYYCLEKLPKTNDVRKQITQIQETAEIALNDVRSIAKNLSPYHLEKAGLTNTISFMLKQVAESSEIEFVTNIENVDGILPKENEINLYRIVQEAANNIVKHSKATQAKVDLNETEKGLILKIKDNGVGFNQSENDYQNFGTGLNGITERARTLNGNLTINSVPQKGTEIIMEIGVSK